MGLGFAALFLKYISDSFEEHHARLEAEPFQEVSLAY